MRYRKISLRELRFGKSLVTFERLEQLIGEGFMCRLGKHAVSNQPIKHEWIALLERHTSQSEEAKAYQASSRSEMIPPGF